MGRALECSDLKEANVEINVVCGYRQLITLTYSWISSKDMIGSSGLSTPYF